MKNKRWLGGIETFFCIAHDLCRGANNAGMLISIEGPINVDVVKQALYHLYLRHPLLSATYNKDKKSGRYYFQWSIDFDEIEISLTTADHVELAAGVAALENVINQPYQQGGSLWRVNLLRSTGDKPIHYLIFCFHHAIIDGISEMRVVKDFMHYYHAIENNKIIKTTRLTMPLSLEDCLSTTIKRADYKQNHQTIIDRYGFPKELMFEKNVPLLEVSTKIMLCDFEYTRLEKILACSKTHHIKVNSLFIAALLLAMQKVTGHTETFMQVALNVRPYMKPTAPHDDLACYITGVKTIMKNLDTYDSLLELAQAHQRQYADNFKLSYVPPYDFLTEDKETLLKRISIEPRKQFLLGPAISNWGSVTINEEPGTLKINAIHRATNRQMAESPFYLHIATINQSIQGAFNYPFPYISQQTMSDISQTFRQLLNNIS